MNLDLTALMVILVAIALALGAGWWMGRRRAAAIEAERTIAIDRAMDQLDRRFDDLAGRQLQENIENFLRLARENLGGHQQAAHSSLKEREQAIEALIKPIQESLAQTSEALREIESERQRDFGSLRQHLTDMRETHTALQRETRNLVQALSKPQVRGQCRHASDNRVELERARHALQLAAAGRKVVVVSGGDPGVFAMAAAVFEAVEAGEPAWRDLDIRVEPGVTAMLAAAAEVGAPLGGDFCAISLSDYLNSWATIFSMQALHYALKCYEGNSPIRAGGLI